MSTFPLKQLIVPPSKNPVPHAPQGWRDLLLHTAFQRQTSRGWRQKYDSDLLPHTAQMWKLTDVEPSSWARTKRLQGELTRVHACECNTQPCSVEHICCLDACTEWSHTDTVFLFPQARLYLPNCSGQNYGLLQFGLRGAYSRWISIQRMTEQVKRITEIRRTSTTTLPRQGADCHWAWQKEVS